MKPHLTTIDPVWEEKYSAGHAERYPWDCIVTFVYRYYPRDKQKQDVRILEVGCGAGSNLWFAAREGFDVTGIEGSASAIQYAQERFKLENLKGDLRVGDFTALPFTDNTFDLVIDRGALTCAGLSAGKKAVSEVWRVLKKGGYFHANPYSQKSTSYLAGHQSDDGLTLDIKHGSLTGVGQVCFYSRSELQSMFSDKFNLVSIKHLQIDEEQQTVGTYLVHAEWRVIAQPIK
jgi:SAM-dependent methyltransferase